MAGCVLWHHKTHPITVRCLDSPICTNGVSHMPNSRCDAVSLHSIPWRQILFYASFFLRLFLYFIKINLFIRSMSSVHFIFHHFFNTLLISISIFLFQSRWKCLWHYTEILVHSSIDVIIIRILFPLGSLEKKNVIIWGSCNKKTPAVSMRRCLFLMLSLQLNQHNKHQG